MASLEKAQRNTIFYILQTLWNSFLKGRKEEKLCWCIPTCPLIQIIMLKKKTAKKIGIFNKRVKIPSTWNIRWEQKNYLWRIFTFAVSEKKHTQWKQIGYKLLERNLCTRQRKMNYDTKDFHLTITLTILLQERRRPTLLCQIKAPSILSLSTTVHSVEKWLKKVSLDWKFCTYSFGTSKLRKIRNSVNHVNHKVRISENLTRRSSRKKN